MRKLDIWFSNGLPPTMLTGNLCKKVQSIRDVFFFQYQCNFIYFFEIYSNASKALSILVMEII